MSKTTKTSKNADKDKIEELKTEMNKSKTTKNESKKNKKNATPVDDDDDDNNDTHENIEIEQSETEVDEIIEDENNESPSPSTTKKNRYKKPSVNVQKGLFTKQLNTNPNMLVPLGDTLMRATYEIAKQFCREGETTEQTQADFMKCLSEFKCEDLIKMIKSRRRTENKKERNKCNKFIPYEINDKGKKVVLKKPQNALSIFNEKYKDEIRKMVDLEKFEGRDIVIEITRKRSELWNQHQDKNTKDYKECIQKAKKLKEEYDRKVEELKKHAIETGEFNPRPKKPMSGYFIFSQSDIKNKFKDLSVGDRALEISKLWNKMSEKEKAPYMKKAEEGKIAYKRIYEKWKEIEDNKPESTTDDK